MDLPTRESKNQKYYNADTNIDNFSDKEVMCQMWASIFSQFLTESGIENEIKGSKEEGHRWVIFRADGKYYFADATKNFYHQAIDLGRPNMGVQSFGLFEITRDMYYDRLFGMYYDFNYSELSKNWDQTRAKINRKLGYDFEFIDKKYKDRKKDNNIFDLKRLGLSFNATADQILEAKIEQNIFPKLKNLGTMEAHKWSRILTESYLTEEEQEKVDRHYCYDIETKNAVLVYEVELETKKRFYLFNKNDILEISEDNYINKYPPLPGGDEY